MGIIDSGLRAIFKRMEERVRDNAESEEERKERRRVRTIETLMGFPKDLQRTCLGKADALGNKLRRTDAWRKLQQAAAVPGIRIIVLAGPAGTGKTLAAALWLAQQAQEQDGHAMWLPSPDLDIQADWKEPYLMARSRRALVLDDIGVEEMRGARRAEKLLYHRYVERRMTICTTNLTAAIFHRTYDDRIWSRLGEHGRWMRCEEVVRPDHGELPKEGARR